jgi:hypothetical protein
VAYQATRLDVQGSRGIMHPIGYIWSYLACRIRHPVPVWQARLWGRGEESRFVRRLFDGGPTGLLRSWHCPRLVRLQGADQRAPEPGSVQTFNVLDYTPDWDFTSGGAKVTGNQDGQTAGLGFTSGRRRVGPRLTN